MSLIQQNHHHSQQQQHQQQPKTVKVVNPPAGSPTVVRYAVAMRAVRRGKATIRHDGALVFVYDGIDHARLMNLRNGAPLMVAEYSGQDAFPDRAVMPPSPSVIAQMCRSASYRGPLRPPVRQSVR